MKKATMRVLSLALAFVMAAGMLPTHSFAVAAEKGSFEQIKAVTEGEDTGKSLYTDVSDKGELSGESTVDTLTTADQKVTTTETITGTNMENVFKLDLGVTTRDVKETVSVTPDAAVTLVLDMSASMQSCIVCSMGEGERSVHSEAVRGQVFENWAPNSSHIGSHTFKGYDSICVECWRDKSLHRRMVGHEFVSTLSQAQDAAISFVDIYSGRTEEGGNLGSTKRMVSLVVFSSYGNSGVVLSWVDAATAVGLQQITAAIKGVTANGSTYTTRGMELGRGLLHDKVSLVDAKGAPITNKSMVLLTDGEPTLDNGQALSEGNWSVKVTDAALRGKYVKTERVWENGQSKDVKVERAEYLSPIGLGMTLKDENIDLYSIYCGNVTENVELDNQSYAGINWMKDFSTAAYSAKDTSELEKAFKAINDEIEIATKAGKVVIPLNKYIVPNDVAALPEGVTYDASANTLSWALGTVAADNDGVRHYNTSFEVKLDTHAEGFVEDAYSLVNLYTYLNYTVEQTGETAENAVKTAAFRVPQVKGALPQVDYTVNYYLKNRDGVAGEPTKDSYTKSDKLGAQVSAEVKTYDGYALDVNQETSIVLGKDAQKNAINLYYHMTPITVSVEHYFTTTTIDENGNKTTDEAPRLVDTVNTWDKDYYKGDSFSASPKADSVTRTFDKAATKEANEYENVKLTGNATIKLYYNELIDNRAPAKVTVNTYIYNIKWELKDGKYTSTASEPKLYDEPISETMKNGEYYTAPNRDKDFADMGYALDTETHKSDSHDPVQLTSKQDTVLNYYYFNVTDKPAETTVLVRHNYTTNTTLVSGGNSETVIIPKEEDQAAARVAGYVGETYTAAPDVNYNGEKWTLDTIHPLSMKLTADESANVIDVYYTRTVDGRTATTVTVNHHYQDWKNVVGEDGQVTQVSDGEAKLETETIKDNVYMGGSYTATIKEKDGYSWDKDGDHSLAVLAETGNVIDIRYDRKPALPDESSSTQVLHVYNTYTTYVDENGKVQIDWKSTEYGEGETLTGSAGEWFDVNTVKSFGGDDYEVVNPTGNPDTVRVTLNGREDTYTITYARYVNKLVETSVKVVPVYTSYEKQIVNGEEKLVQVGEPTEGTAWTNTDPLYVGQNFTADQSLEQFQRDGYAFSHAATIKANPYQNVKLSANGDVIYLHFSNVETPTDGRGESAKIRAVHHYKFVDKFVDENGAYQEKIVRDETVTTTAFEKYAGQTVTIASLVKNDGGSVFTSSTPETSYTVAEADKGKTVTIDLYYYGETNQTETATLTVVHHYTNLDQNGSELLPEDQRTLTVEVKRDKGFHAGESYTVSPEYKNIFAPENITKRSFNGSDLTGFDVKLVKGENKVELYYAKTTDTRVKTTVTVIHQYAVLDANGNKRTAEGASTDTFDTVELGAWVGNDFRAALRYISATNKLAEGELEYKFENASFVRTDANDTATDPSALVVDETSDGKLLQSVKLDENKVVITINYLRNIDTTPSNPGVSYYHVTVAYKDMDGKTLADSYRTASIREGRDYDVTEQAAKAISGYTIDHVEGKVSGKLNGNLTVTVFYASESTIVDPEPPTTNKPDVTDPDENLTDIPEVDVPTTVLPVEPPVTGETVTDDTTIVDEQVPMGNLPQTGLVAQNVNVVMALGALALAASLAAVGLGIVFSRKKEEEN